MITLNSIISLVLAVLSIILFFKIWKMTNDVRDIKERYFKLTNPDVAAAEASGGNAKFKIGDVVVVKKTGSNVRITYIENGNGIFYYSSDTDSERYREDELSGFN